MDNNQKHEISPLDYIGNIEKLEITNPELRKERDRLSENLNILLDSLKVSFQNVDSNLIKLSDYWKEYGHNYDIIPEFSTIPHLENSFRAYVNVTHSEKLLLVKGYIDLLNVMDTIKTKKEEEKKEKKEIKEKKDIDKKMDEMENQAKPKKKPKKTEEIKKEDKEEFNEALEDLDE